ncbi:hypothetical protein QVD17_16052 [Tagetes erecta]|uniref:Cytochrome P450 n=1 Tax=Tagetes erecta TaxID=13708 RepID=A0AAD8P0A0_TARER|nr:hypothetical protein QVD17_16052 [Tagetes erecta]
MHYSLELIVLPLSILLLFYVIFTFNRKTKTTSTEKEAPEPDGAWPIIGHLHLLGSGDQLLYRTLGAMADKYGPAFNVRLGTRRAFVVSSWEVVKECFIINDKALSSRPKIAALKHMCYNYTTFSFGSCTPFWFQMKKITVMELLSSQRVEMLKDVRSNEINSGINELYTRWIQNLKQPLVVELNKWLEHMMLNIVVMTVAGKRYVVVGEGTDEGARCLKAINEFFRLSGVLVVSDAIPFLWWLDLHGYEKQMKKTAKDLDIVLGGWLDEHRRKRKLNLERNKNNVKDFIDVMLSLEDEGQLSNIGHDSDTSIKSTCMALILAGNSATTGTLTWAISLLLNHPDVLKKLQNELDTHVGKERRVEESDLKNLVFLEAIIKETLRLYPVGPLLPREAIEDCTVAGYTVKAGTRLMVNIWKLHRDERVWSDPCKFQPERFMGPGHGRIELKDQPFALLSFGIGRRSCPGGTFALQVLYLTLARLVHSFELGRPGGLPVDMTEGHGLTLPKKKPLEVLLAPRLQATLYDILLS